MEIFIPITEGKGRAVLPYVNRKCLVELVECNVVDTRRYKDLGVPVDNRRFIPEAVMYKYLAHGDSVTVDVVSDFRWAGGVKTSGGEEVALEAKDTFEYKRPFIGKGDPNLVSLDADIGAYYIDKLAGTYYGPYQDASEPYWGVVKSFGTGVVVFKDSYYDDVGSKWTYNNASSKIRFHFINSSATVWRTSGSNTSNGTYEPARVLGYKELVNSGRNADDFYRVHQNEWITGANYLENTSGVNSVSNSSVYPPGCMTPQAMPCLLDDPVATSIFEDDVYRRRFGGTPFYNPVAAAPKCAIITDDYTYKDGMTLAQFQAISQLLRYNTTGEGPVTFSQKGYLVNNVTFTNPFNPEYYSGTLDNRLVPNGDAYLYSKFTQARDPDANYYEYFVDNGVILDVWVELTVDDSNDTSSLHDETILRAQAKYVLRDLVDITVANALKMLRNGIGLRLFKRNFTIPPGSYALEGSMSFLSQRYRVGGAAPATAETNRWTLPTAGVENATYLTESPLHQLQVGVAITSSNDVSTPVLAGYYVNSAAFPGSLGSNILGDPTLKPTLFQFNSNQTSLAYGYGTKCPLVPWYPLTNRISPYVTGLTLAAEDTVDHLYSFVGATSGAWVKNVTMKRFHARSSVNSTSRAMVSMRDMPHAWRTDLGVASQDRTNTLKVLIGNPTRTALSAEDACQLGYDINTRRSQGQWVANAFSVQRLHLTPILETPYETITLNDTGTVCFENVSSIGPMAYTFSTNFIDTGVQGAFDSFSPFVPAKTTEAEGNGMVGSTYKRFKLKTDFTGTNFYDIPSITNSTLGETPDDLTATSQLQCDGPIRDGQFRYPYVPKTTRVTSSVYPSWVAHVRGGMISTSTVSAYMSGYVKLRLSFLDVTVETSRHVSTVPGADFMAL